MATFPSFGQGLPDVLLSNQKIPIWVNFGGLRLENVALFHEHLEYFTEIWEML
jgi:hypothetical protein